MSPTVNWRVKRDWTNIAHLLDVASGLGLVEAQCLNNTGLSRPDEDQAHATIELWQELALIRNLVAHPLPPGAGLLIGQRYHLTTLGLLGYAMLSSKTLLEAIKVCGQFRELSLSICPVSVRKETEGLLLMLDDRVLPEDARCLVVERGLSAWHSLFTDLLQRQFVPLRVEMRVSQAMDAALYQNHFQCPVHLGAKRNGLLIAWADLAETLPLANPATQQTCASLCRKLCDELSDIRTPLARQVFQLLMGRRGQLYSAREVAGWLGLSERTLHRRLAQEGQPFRVLDEQVRLKLAQGLLRDSHLGLERIAQQVGYAEAASFSRAFKRWTGLSPSHWRQRSADGSNGGLGLPVGLEAVHAP